MRRWLFVLILGGVVGVSSAFAKACPELISGAELEFKPYTLFTQSQQKPTSAEEIYKTLDTFLENPDTEHISTFEDYLTNIEVEHNEARLAKVIAHSNLAYFQRKNGQLQDAITNYTKAWGICDRYNLQDFDILDSCLKPLGNLYTQTNALEEAQNTIEQYLLRAQKSKDKDAIAGGILNLSVVFYSQGKHRQAIQLLEEGLLIQPKNADLWMNLASNLFGNKQDDEAIIAVKKSIALKPSEPNAYKLLGQIYANQGAYDNALEAFYATLELLNKNQNTISRDLAKTHLAIAQTYISQTIALEQPRYFQKAKLEVIKTYQLLIPNFESNQEQPTINQLYSENTLLDALDLHSEIATLENDHLKALEISDLAFEVQRIMQLDMMMQGSQLVMQSSMKRRTERYLENAFMLYQQKRSDSLLQSVLNAIERSKNTLVSSAYLEKKQLSQLSENPLVDKITFQEQQVAQAQEKLQKLRKVDAVESNVYQETLGEYGNASRQVQHLKKQLASEFPLLQDKGISLSDLKEKTAQKNQTFVHYFIGKENSYQFAVNGSEVIFKPITLSASEQENLITTTQNFNRFFTDAGQINSNPQLYAQTAFELYKQLQIPKKGQLIICPDGILNFVPFVALLMEETATISYEKMPFLVKECTLSYELSARLYLEMDKKMSDSSSALGVFPVFEGTDLELSYSMEEAQVLESYFMTELLMREEAVAESVLSTAPKASFAKAYNHNVLHFSTHATGGTFSKPAMIRFYDAEVPVTRFYGESFLPDLVVLSACETGVGKLIAGEGAQSLARGFQFAGARNVLFTLWQVNDRSTARLMGDYYQNLSKITSRNLSLHNAQLSYLNDSEITNAQKSPYYWAPFVYYGTTEIVQESTLWKWALGVVIVVFLSLIIFKNGVTSRVFNRKRVHES
ncbi:CHAT domain-containing protein [Dokdonia sinensis]|uniref:CHAT domain-containing protein n=1 Tax=Dokdonia sinensis TaxID=2479847 RepID=A0A3M0FVH4_9FLAO|nr:CHAT domain-containing protein [Dokdonia sinensis]RMB56780.1 CHAT domain-containing protein [Dokdonia sinensis]